MLAYLGPDGTFSHRAALDYSRGGEIRAYPTIYSAITAVQHDKADAAIVPIENSVEGSVNATLDTLAFDADLFITDEYILRVAQNLMVKSGTKKEDIKTIISHPQAIGQCSKFLETQFPEAKIETVSSTAAAAEYVQSSDGTAACIAAEGSALLYGLDIIVPDCNDDPNNSTRFVIVSKTPSREVSDRDKSSIVFTVDSHTPGALCGVVEQFARSNINMTKIESRPVKTELGKYVFFVDIEGNIDNPTIYFALDEIKRRSKFYKFLGSYKYRQ